MMPISRKLFLPLIIILFMGSGQTLLLARQYLPDHYLVAPIVHDVAVLDIAPYATVLGYNTSSSVNVTVEDQGNVPETFNVSLLIGGGTVGMQTVSLLQNQTVVLDFPWIAPSGAGKYVIVGYASEVSGEVDLADNIMVFPNVTVSIPGDVNGDGFVDIVDVSIVAAAFGTVPGNLLWNPSADVNEDGVINILDLVIAARNIGEAVN
jgi:hypothetical protein